MADWTDAFVEYATEERVEAILAEDPYISHEDLVERLKNDMMDDALTGLREKGILMEVDDDQYFTTNFGAEIIDEMNRQQKGVY